MSKNEANPQYNSLEINARGTIILVKLSYFRTSSIIKDFLKEKKGLDEKQIQTMFDNSQSFGQLVKSESLPQQFYLDYRPELVHIFIDVLSNRIRTLPEKEKNVINDINQQFNMNSLHW